MNLSAKFNSRCKLMIAPSTCSATVEAFCAGELQTTSPSSAERSAFTVRQMLTSEFDGEFVSPLTTFGISPEEFKKQSMGLASIFPDFISCSFTLGLDEVQLFPETKKRADVVEIILQK